MKWFKHDSDASLDAKLARVRMKYGMEGYGLYWFCLEAIARNVERHNLTFELEHDAFLIADATRINHERVEEMMRFMVDLSLFENTGGRITCLKMATRTDEYTQKLIKSSGVVGIESGECPDTNPIKSELIEEKRREEKRATPEQFDEFWALCPRKKNKGQAKKAWKKISADTVNEILQDLKTRSWPKDIQFAPYPATYLNAEAWTDEEEGEKDLQEEWV